MAIPTSGKTEIIIQFGEDAKGKANEPNAPQQEGADLKDPVGKNEEKKEKNNKNAVISHMAFDTVKTLGMQALNASVSQIGLSTGNYYAQAQVQRTMSSITNTASLIATAIASPVSAAVSIASIGISSYFEIKQQNKEREIANYQAEQLSKRIGYSTPRR